MEMMQARGIDFDTRIIKNFSFVDPTTRESSVRITFADGSSDIVKGVLIKTKKVQRSPLAPDMGVKMNGDDAVPLSRNVSLRRKTLIIGRYECLWCVRGG